jgi:hypothetical protein
MSYKIPSLLVLVVCVILQWTAGAQPAGTPVLDKLTIPPYPFFARLVGTEGTIQVNITLDAHCNIENISVLDGPERLADEVTRAIHSGGLHLGFRPCASTHTTNVRLSFVFVLRGQPTNAWSPTYARVTSGAEPSFNIEITTTPADPKSLGLEKKRAHTQKSGATQ